MYMMGTCLKNEKIVYPKDHIGNSLSVRLMKDISWENLELRKL